MHPEKLRMGTDYVYATAPSSYKYYDAVEYCVFTYNASLPTITTREDSLHIATHHFTELNGE